MRILLRFASLPLLAGFLMVGTTSQCRAGTITFALKAPDPVVSGSAYVVDVFLEESGDAPYILNTDGIFAAAFTVSFSNGTPFQAVANPGFDIATATIAAGQVTFDLSAFLNPNVTSDPATPNQLWLGSVSFIAGPPQWVSVSVSVKDPSLDNVVTGSGVVLDDELGTATLRLASVPEPSSVLMLSLGAVAGLGLVRRRRRAA